MKGNKPKPSSRTAAPRQVRIIGGQWKRTPLGVPDAQGLRPTPDRVRETVFNWLNHLIDGQWDDIVCLDLFAGTGALGFEAASRGAGQVTMVEASAAAVRQLEASKEKLHAGQVRILHGDALTTAQRLAARGSEAGNRFNLVFLDPPYHQDWLPKVLSVCEHLLTDNGMVYAESEQAFDNNLLPAWLEGWEVVRADKAGMVNFHLLKRNGKL
ncbi:MAG: rsmD [Herminiimonas sp.]|jgi:16S rRNA (guanine966-N2)-methyltransferase|nr:rsmD [Herminiimonas sp.]